MCGYVRVGVDCAVALRGLVLLGSWKHAAPWRSAMTDHNLPPDQMQMCAWMDKTPLRSRLACTPPPHTTTTHTQHHNPTPTQTQPNPTRPFTRPFTPNKTTQLQRLTSCSWDADSNATGGVTSPFGVSDATGELCISSLATWMPQGTRHLSSLIKTGVFRKTCQTCSRVQVVGLSGAPGAVRATYSLFDMCAQAVSHAHRRRQGVMMDEPLRLTRVDFVTRLSGGSAGPRLSLVLWHSNMGSCLGICGFGAPSSLCWVPGVSDTIVDSQRHLHSHWLWVRHPAPLPAQGTASSQVSS